MATAIDGAKAGERQHRQRHDDSDGDRGRGRGLGGIGHRERAQQGPAGAAGDLRAWPLARFGCPELISHAYVCNIYCRE
jgi:hypothetical protein